MKATFRSCRLQLRLGGGRVVPCGQRDQRAAQDGSCSPSHGARRDAVGFVMALAVRPSPVLSSRATPRTVRTEPHDAPHQALQGAFAMGLAILISRARWALHVYTFAFLLGLRDAFDAPARRLRRDMVSDKNSQRGRAKLHVFRCALVGSCDRGMLIAGVGRLGLPITRDLARFGRAGRDAQAEC